MRISIQYFAFFIRGKVGLFLVVVIPVSHFCDKPFFRKGGEGLLITILLEKSDC
jgi:hypothetical protein